MQWSHLTKNMDIYSVLPIKRDFSDHEKAAPTDREPDILSPLWDIFFALFYLAGLIVQLVIAK